MPRWGFRHDPEGAFWSKVDRTGGPDACWPWLAAEDRNGYGAVKWEGKKRGAHVVAWMLVNGRWPEPGMDVCHTCVQNRLCCNPAHLYEGTRKQNVADMVQAGTLNIEGRRFGGHTRAGQMIGSINPSTELEEDQVLEIDRLIRAGWRYRQIAAETGVSLDKVKDIAAGRSWAWLTGRKANRH